MENLKFKADNRRTLYEMTGSQTSRVRLYFK